MKLSASVVAVFATGPILAAMAACGYCHGYGEAAVCALVCMLAVAASGIIAFAGLVAFGWLAALAGHAVRAAAAH